MLNQKILNVSRWRQFWLEQALGTLLYFTTAFVISVPLNPGSVYMGQNTDSLFKSIIHSYTTLVIFSALKIFSVAILISFTLQILSAIFSYTTRAFLCLLFYALCIIRTCAIYPALAENWRPFSGQNGLRLFLVQLASLPENSWQRIFVEWAPFGFILILGLIQFVFYFKFFILQNRKIIHANRSHDALELDLESRKFARGSISFLLAAIAFITALFCTNNSFSFSLSREDLGQSKPLIFIFAIDSLRMDRLTQPEFAEVMPFLRKRAAEAALFKPMLVGVPRTFPSWVEIAKCQYSNLTGVRTMFPSRAVRQSASSTLFSAAADEGYETTFVSDFAGDVFPRYNFGIKHIHAPTSNLTTLVENSILQSFVSLQSFLVLPKMHRLLPSLLESAEFADPRLLALKFADALNSDTSQGRPIFATTFFSTAHFPYAAPAPWFREFQKNTPQNQQIFRKDSDQISNANDFKSNGTEKTKANALYNASLKSIDSTLEQIWNELEAKGWSENALFLFFGDHGENLYDGNLGMGHGDGVSGEFATQTPLIVLTRGRAESAVVQDRDESIVRTVDIAPTIARRTGLKLDLTQCDGTPLLDIADKSSNFPRGSAYQESGLWFTSGTKSPEGSLRQNYPGITGLLDIDPGLNYEFVIRSSLVSPINSVKERAWINDKFRLITRSGTNGIVVSLYDRVSDPASSTDLLLESENKTKYISIAQELLRQLNIYLQSRGVEIVRNSDGHFFYSESLAR